MKIETELNVGDVGFFLLGSNIVQETIDRIYVSVSDGVFIEYGFYREARQSVPQNRAAKTKAALLAKL